MTTKISKQFAVMADKENDMADVYSNVRSLCPDKTMALGKKYGNDDCSNLAPSVMTNSLPKSKIGLHTAKSHSNLNLAMDKVPSSKNFSCFQVKKPDTDDDQNKMVVPYTLNTQQPLIAEECQLDDVHVKPVKYPNYVVESSFLSKEDSARLWDLISKFIERRFERRQGVSLPSLGIITLFSHKFQIGSDMYQHEMKPVFLVRGKFALLHRLQRPTIRTSSDIPTLQLNFSTIARLLAVERDRVEMAYYETLEKISSLLRAGKKVVLPFRGVGHLVFHLETVKMIFLPSFKSRFEKNVRERGVCDVGFRPFLP